MVSEPTCWALCNSGAGCLSNDGVYLLGTVLQWCRLFKRCQNLTYRGAGCLSGVRTYLLGTVLQWCRLFKQCQNLPTGYRGAGFLSTVLQWCRLFKQCQNLPTGYRDAAFFKRCQNLPAGNCVTVMQTFYEVTEPTCLALCYSGADCLSGVRTFLPGTVLQWSRLLKGCQNLPAGHCVTGLKTF